MNKNDNFRFKKNNNKRNNNYNKVNRKINIQNLHLTYFLKNQNINLRILLEILF